MKDLKKAADGFKSAYENLQSQIDRYMGGPEKMGDVSAMQDDSDMGEHEGRDSDDVGPEGPQSFEDIEKPSRKKMAMTAMKKQGF